MLMLSVPGAAAPAFLGAEGAGVGFAVGSMFLTGTEAGSTYGPPGAIIGGILGALASVFEDLFSGGGPSYPAWYIREAKHPGGLVPIVAQIEGLPKHYPPNQEKSAPSPRRVNFLFPKMTEKQLNSYYSCLERNLYSGDNSGVAPVCIGSAIGCLAGIAPACGVGLAVCTYGVSIELHCMSKALGGTPPPLTESPVPPDRPLENKVP